MKDTSAYPVLRYLVEYDGVGGTIHLKAKFLKEESAKAFVKIQKAQGNKNIKMYVLTPEGFKQRELKVR